MNISRGKTAFLVLLLVGSSYYGISKYRSLTPSSVINNGVSNEYGGHHREPGKRDAKEGEAKHQSFVKMANLTPDQEARMKTIRDSGVDGRDRWTSMAAVLTPDQRQRMAAAREERRDRGAKATLSNSDFTKYKQKRDQMRAAHGPRGGGHRGGRGGSAK